MGASQGFANLSVPVFMMNTDASGGTPFPRPGGERSRGLGIPDLKLAHSDVNNREFDGGKGS